MTVRTLQGRFTEFEGILDVGSDGETTASGAVKVASIDTGEPVRDEHLCSSAEFFDVERHPAISFVSTRIERHAEGYRMLGAFTMRGVTRDLALDAQLDQASGTAAREEDHVALRLRGELDRRQFGLIWNELLDSGGVLVGNKVKISLRIVAVKTPSDRTDRRADAAAGSPHGETRSANADTPRMRLRRAAP